MYSAYRQRQDLIAVGAYQKGSDPQVDQAIAMWPRLVRFLQQEVEEPVELRAAQDQLGLIAAEIGV
jgi:flagellum-specific ATP synthase